MADISSTRYSILDLAPVRAGGTLMEAFRNTAELARHAEQWGYTRFWLAEHHNMPGIGSAATTVLIGHVAGQTSTLRIGSGGIMLPNHSSLVIAEQFGTLETLYPGRIDLGVGRAPGSDGLTARAIGRDLGNAEEEFPGQVRELLAYLGTGSPGQRVRAIPGEGTNVPVWLLGSSTYSAQLAAALGLPFAFASHFAPQQLLEAVSLYRQSFQPSKFLGTPYVMIGIPLVAADTEERARHLATTPYQRILALIRGNPIYMVPPVDSMDGLWNTQERALVERKLGAAVIGGPETIRGKLSSLLAATRADEAIFTSDLYEPSDRMRSYEVLAEVMGTTTGPLNLSPGIERNL
ncbi:MAG TPA: LLM class flavin-dependent oxidoreductase [Bryobacteraceae bacterium]|nr:LLM class flavin-dependent oxidoreductase [Bryobacteraceae bacterium]